jgi:ketosteroid isomerase-like protein
MKFLATFTIALTLIMPMSLKADDTTNSHVGDLQVMFDEVTRTVEAGDFDAMAATYHKDAILVTANSSLPISKAIASWRVDGKKLADEGSTATVSFRFSDHKHGETTSFETGIFRYSITNSKGEETAFLAHFQELLIKQGGKWLCMMEHQIKSATQAEWDALK